jgi:hypothetical protein
MTRLKAADYGNFDVKALDVEYDDDFTPYTGEIPRSNLLLRGFVKKLWWTFANDGETPMLKVLWIADGNVGKTEEFNGLPVWDQMVFQPNAAFKYGPFLETFGITLTDVFKKLDVADEDDNQGAPVNYIAHLVPGEDAVCGIITKKDKYEGEFRAKAQKFVPWGEDDDAEEEPEEEPPPKTRGARSAANGSSRAKSRKPEPEPEPDDDDVEPDDAEYVDDDDDDDVEPEPPAKPARRPAATKPPTRPAKPAAKAAPARRGRVTKGDNTDPPF